MLLACLRWPFTQYENSNKNRSQARRQINCDLSPASDVCALADRFTSSFSSVSNQWSRAFSEKPRKKTVHVSSESASSEGSRHESTLLLLKLYLWATSLELYIILISFVRLFSGSLVTSRILIRWVYRTARRRCFTCLFCVGSGRTLCSQRNNAVLLKRLGRVSVCTVCAAGCWMSQVYMYTSNRDGGNHNNRASDFPDISDAPQATMLMTMLFLFFVRFFLLFFFVVSLSFTSRAASHVCTLKKQNKNTTTHVGL